MTKTSKMRRLGQVLLLGAAGCCSLAAQAQAPADAAPVLRGAEVTEDALIDALAVEAPQSEGGTMRGFRPARPGEKAPVKAGPGRASLLITFGTNSTELAGDSQKALDTVARALQSDTLAGNTFLVEGHADARGDAERNLTLSQSRAESVVAYLVAHHGILAERLEARGKGSTEPMNRARADAPENRRVTIVTRRN